MNTSIIWYEGADGCAHSVTREGLAALLESGAVTAETLVWREGMRHWRSLAVAMGLRRCRRRGRRRQRGWLELLLLCRHSILRYRSRPVGVESGVALGLAVGAWTWAGVVLVLALMFEWWLARG